VEFGAHFLEGGEVGGVVFYTREAAFADDKGEDALVPEDGAAASPAGLLESGGFSAGVVEADVEGAPVAVLGGPAGGDGGDGGQVVFVCGEGMVEGLGDVVGVALIRGGGIDADRSFVAVDGDDHVLRGLALHGKGVEAGGLEVGAEVASGVAVVGLLREGREEDGVGLAGAGVLGDAADGAPGDDKGVFGGVPPALRGDGVPEDLEAEPPASGEGIDHGVIDVMDGVAVVPVAVPEIYDKVFAGVAPVQGGPVVAPFGEELHVECVHAP